MAKTKTRTRSPIETRKSILELAFLEVYRHGFKGTSTNTIIEKMQLTRGAFFHHFPTKEDLGYSLIDEVLSEMIITRWIHPLQGAENPIHEILKNFNQLIEQQRDEDILCGCPLNNLVQEMADQPIFQKKIQSIMELWIEETLRYVKLAKQRGYLSKNANSRSIAEFIVACQEAAFSMGKALNSREKMYNIQKNLRLYLKSLESSPTN